MVAGNWCIRVRACLNSHCDFNAAICEAANMTSVSLFRPWALEQAKVVSSLFPSPPHLTIKDSEVHFDSKNNEPTTVSVSEEPRTSPSTQSPSTTLLSVESAPNISVPSYESRLSSIISSPTVTEPVLAEHDESQSSTASSKTERTLRWQSPRKERLAETSAVTSPVVRGDVSPNLFFNSATPTSPAVSHPVPAPVDCYLSELYLAAYSSLLSAQPPLPPPPHPAAYHAGVILQQQQQQVRKLRPKKHRCPHCQVAFSNNGQLRGHVRIHTGERPFRCSCGKSFTRNEELTRHKRIHSGVRPFSCDFCDKRFGRKDHLKKHARTHIPQPPHPGLGLHHLPITYLYGL